MRKCHIAYFHSHVTDQQKHHVHFGFASLPQIETPNRTSVLALITNVWYYPIEFRKSTLIGIENRLTESDQKGHRSALYCAKLSDT
jgi:hypothetical protein